MKKAGYTPCTNITSHRITFIFFHDGGREKKQHFGQKVMGGFLVSWGMAVYCMIVLRLPLLQNENV